MATLKSIEKWTAHITAARKHPGGVKAYCKQAGVKTNNYYFWFKKLRAQHPEWDKPIVRGKPAVKQKAPTATCVEFLPVSVVPAATKKAERMAVEIQLPNGAVMFLPDGMSVDELAAFVGRVEANRC